MFSKLLDKFLSLKNLYFIALSICIVVFLWKNIDISIMLFVAIIFAAALNPLVDKLSLKMKRPLATALAMLGFLILIGIFIIPIIFIAIYEITEFAKDFPQYVVNLDNYIRDVRLLSMFGITHINVTSLIDAFASSSADVFDNILEFMSGASAALLYIFTDIVLIFFFIVDKDKVKETFVKFFPSEYRQKAKEISTTVCEKLSGYVFAQTVVSGSVWLTMTLGLILFKINYPLLLGLISGILSIIPIIGSAFSFIICLIATYEMGAKALIIVTMLFTISHFVENNLVRPYVYSKFLNLHQIIIFIALVIGAKYLGVLGVILAPPFAMALYILLDEFYIKKMDE